MPAVSDVSVTVEPSNGRTPRRVVKLLCGGVEHVDTIDPLSGFERDKLLDRAAQRFGQPRHLMGCLHDAIVKAAQRVDAQPEAQRPFRCYSMQELDDLDLSADYIFRNALVVGSPGVIGAREKSLKTGIALDCGISMATFTSWLGHFECIRAARSVYFVGEGGLLPARDWCRRIAKSKGLPLPEVAGFFLCDEVPSLNSDSDLATVAQRIRDYEAEFAFFDPLYLMLADQAAGASNVYAMGTMLGRMLKACREAHATPIVLHHFKKSQPIGQAPELSDLSQAGVAEFAGQWWLLNRQRPYDEENPGEHDLIVRLGSRMGFSSKWMLHAEEGTLDAPGGRYWRPQVSAMAEARAHQKAQREATREQQQADRLRTCKEKIVRTMARLKVATMKTRIRDESGLFDKDFRLAFAALLEEGSIATDEVYVSNHKKPSLGYRLAENA